MSKNYISHKSLDFYQSIEITNWCIDHCKEWWFSHALKIEGDIHYYTFEFISKEDYMLFVLTWINR